MAAADAESELFARAQQLASEVKDLPDELKEELAHRLNAAWPEDGFSSLVQRDEDHGWTVSWAAVAWTSYGPALDLELPPDQWVQIAASGIILGEALEWLRRGWTPEADELVVAECESTDARTWGTLVDATPARLTDAFAGALCERLTEVREADHFELTRIGERLRDENRLEALRLLSAKNETFADLLRPHLASLGDPDALRHLLGTLKQSLADRKRVDRHDLMWLGGAAQEQFLDELFECLVLARSLEDDPFGASGMLESAIAQTGGPAAIQKYDEVIAAKPFYGAQFLRLQRDRLAQAELRKAGDEHAQELVTALGLPLLRGLDA